MMIWLGKAWQDDRRQGSPRDRGSALFMIEVVAMWQGAGGEPPEA